MSTSQSAKIVNPSVFSMRNYYSFNFEFFQRFVIFPTQYTNHGSLIKHCGLQSTLRAMKENFFKI